MNEWDEIWKQKNEEFEVYLTEHGLHAFKNKMFHIWDGNHRFKAWYNTKEMKLGGVEYHISPTSIILDGRKENTIRNPRFFGRQRKWLCAFTLTWKYFFGTSPKIRYERQAKNTQ